MVSSYDYDLKLAVMGCVVNGPGEAKEADLGIAGGDGCGVLIKHGEVVRKVPEDELLSTLKVRIRPLGWYRCINFLKYLKHSACRRNWAVIWQIRK